MGSENIVKFFYCDYNFDMLPSSEYSYVRDLFWPEVFEHWREREAIMPEWIHCATKIKGWPNWESWRMNSAHQFDAPHRTWKQFEIKNPFKTIPQWLLGPFPSWFRDYFPHFEKYEEHTFQEMVEKNNSFLQRHKKIEDIIRHFPCPTEMIGIWLSQEQKMVCYEGTHRATAVALAQYTVKNISFPILPKIVVTEFTDKEKKFLDIMLSLKT